MADVTLTLGVNTAAAEAAIARLSRKKVHLGGVNSRNFTVPLGRIQGQLGEFNKSLMASNARVLAFGASAGAIMAVSKGFTELVKSTISVEKKLAEINVVLGTSQSRLKAFGNELFNAAANAGMGFDAAAEAATEFSRQGLGLEKTLKRVNDALVLSRLTGLQVADSVNAITAAINGYNLTLKEQENLVSRIIAVDQAFAVSGADIAEAMRRVASTAKGAGVSLNELIAIVTAAQQKTARGGAVIGNSFKTIFTRLQRPRTLEALDQLGIKTRDATGAMLPAMQVLTNLAKGYDRLTHAQKSNVAQLVGGVFQINILKAAIGDLSREFSIYGNALDIANGATNEADARNAELNKTLSAQFNKALQGVTKLAAAIGDLAIAPALEKIVSGLNSFFGNIEGESQSWGAKLGTGLMGGLGAFLSGPGLLMLGVGLVKLFQFLAKQARDAAKTIMTMGKAQEHRAALQDRIMTQLQNEPKLLQKILRGEIDIDKVHDSILKDIKAENEHLKTQEQIAKRLASLLAKKTKLTGGGAPTIVSKAEGYIPNYALSPMEKERRNAMRLGASSRVQGYYDPRVRIKGKKGAIVNTEEDVIHNFARGESAVIPQYPNGHIPGPKPKGGVSHRGYKKLLLPEGGFGVISVGGAPSVTEATGGLELTPSVLKSAGFKKAQMGISVMNLDHFRPMELLKGGLESSGNFKKMIQKPLGDAILEISKKLLGATPDEIPNPTKVGDLVTRDKAAYPQMAGRIFEKALSGAIEDPRADFDKSGTSRWDFTKASFNNRKTAVKSMFGKTQGQRLLNTNKIDSKLDVSSDAYKKSMAKKLSPELRAQYGKQLGPFSGGAKAAGYIPNFANALGDAIGREHDAGIPYNQMRIHTDKAGQPIAVTNKRDEPNGLRDVAKGYIPNFAGGAGGAMAWLKNLKEKTFMTYEEIAQKAEIETQKIVNADAEVIAKRKEENIARKKAKKAINGEVEAEKKLAQEREKQKKARSRGATEQRRAANRVRQAQRKLSEAQAKTTSTANALTQATQRRATAETTAAAASPHAKTGARAAAMDKAGGHAMMASFAAPMLAGGLAGLSGAGEDATKALTDGASAIGMGAMVFSMMPNAAGATIGALLAIGGAAHAFAKYLGTKHLAQFQEAAENGKEQLEKFNASSQSLSTALDGLQSEYAKMKPDAAKILSLQNQYATALGELPPAIRAQVLSAGDLAGVQENLAKAQAKMAQEQKGKEAAAALAKAQKGATGIGNMYGLARQKEDLGGGISSGGAGMGAAGYAAVGAAAGAAIGSVVPVIGTAVGAAAGAAIGAVTGAVISLNQTMKAAQGEMDTEVFGEGEDALNLKSFTQDVAKSLDYTKLAADQASGKLDIMGMSGRELANELTNTYGASTKLSAMLKNLAAGDIMAFKAQLELMTINANNARREMEALNQVFERNARIQQAIQQVMDRQAAAIKTMLAALNTQIEGRRAEGELRDKGRRGVARKRFDAETKLMDPFMTDEAKAERETKGKKFDVEEKRLAELQKAQTTGRGDIMKAAMAAAGDDPKAQAAIRAAQQANAAAGGGNQDLINALNGIQHNGNALLQNNQAFQAEASAAQAQQNTTMRQADIKAQTQIDILNMQLALQKKQLQIQKDIKTLGGLNTFMDPEAAAKKAEDFEKGLGAYSKGGVRGDKMQQGRGAVQLLRSAMDAGVDIMGPGAEGMKQQAIEGNAAFLKQTFTDRATRLRTTAAEMRGAGDAAGAAKLEEQARGYEAQAGRANEIAANQVYAEFKKSQMPENISQMLTAEQELVRLQQQDMAKRQKDFANAIREAGVDTRLNALHNAISQQTAMQVQMEKAKEKGEKEAKKVKAEEEKKSAQQIIDKGRRGRRGLAAVALGHADAAGSDEGYLEDLGGGGTTAHRQEGMEKAIRALMKGARASGEQIGSMADLKGFSDAELTKFLKAGGITSADIGGSDVADFAENVFGSDGGYLSNLLSGEGGSGTEAYVESMDQFIDALNTVETADAEIAALSEAAEKADKALKQATESVNTMNAALVAAQNQIANQSEAASLEGKKENVQQTLASDLSLLNEQLKVAEQKFGKDSGQAKALKGEIARRKEKGQKDIAALDTQIAAAQAGQGASSIGAPPGTAPLPQAQGGANTAQLPTANTNAQNAIPGQQQGTGYAAGPLVAPGPPAGAAGGNIMNNIATDPEGGGVGDLAANLGNLVTQLGEGIQTTQNVNFNSALPLNITVAGEMTTLISPQQQAQIEQAVIARLQGANAVTPQQATQASGPPA